MVDRFLNFDVQLLTADSFRNDVAGLATIRIRASARPRLLRIPAIVFDEPRSRLHQFEVSPGALRRKRKHRDDKKKSHRISHGVSPFPTVKRPAIIHTAASGSELPSLM